MRSICPKREECAYMTNIRQWLITAAFAVSIVCISSLSGSNSTSANAQIPNTTSTCGSTSPTSAPAEEEPIGPSVMGFFGGGFDNFTGAYLVQAFSNMLTAKIITGTQTTTSTTYPTQVDQVALNPSTDTQAGGPCKVPVATKK